MAPKSKLSERIPVLNDYIRRHGRAPTLEELCGLFRAHATEAEAGGTSFGASFDRSQP